MSTDTVWLSSRETLYLVEYLGTSCPSQLELLLLRYWTFWLNLAQYARKCGLSLGRLSVGGGLKLLSCFIHHHHVFIIIIINNK